jgi:hypothetical protein
VFFIFLEFFGIFLTLFRERYFTKLTLYAEKRSILLELAKLCRRALLNKARANEEEEEKYMPHVSLVYAYTDAGAVKDAVAKDLEDAGIFIGENAGGRLNGWKGGSIVVVECWREVRDWKIVARRDL